MVSSGLVKSMTDGKLCHLNNTLDCIAGLNLINLRKCVSLSRSLPYGCTKALDVLGVTRKARVRLSEASDDARKAWAGQ